MKPKDLKAPFCWEDRQPLISDCIFHVPRYYHAHHEFSFPGWEGNFLFNNQNPTCIEYCSGNGDWIVNRAKQFAHLNWIAVEIRFDRAQKIWSKIKNEKLDNLFVVFGEGLTFTHHYVPYGAIEAVFINFPDPWPKRRHAKHRLVKEGFLNELVRILGKGKEVTFVTDDFNYLKDVVDLFQTHRGFDPVLPKPYFTDLLTSYGTSWFEMLCCKMKRNISYTQFKTHG